MRFNDKALSFAAQMDLEKGAVIFFNEGLLQNGQNYYLYLAVKGNHVEEYYRLIGAPDAPTLDALKRLGTVISVGQGTVPDDVKTELEERYGAYHP